MKMKDKLNQLKDKKIRVHMMDAGLLLAVCEDDTYEKIVEVGTDYFEVELVSPGGVDRRTYSTDKIVEIDWT